MKTMGFRKFITLSLSTVCALSLSSCFKDEPLNAECDIEQAYIHPGSWLKLWFTNASDTLVNVQSDQDKIEFTMKPFASLKKQAPMFRLTPGGTCIQVRTSGFSKFADTEIPAEVLSGKWKVSVTGVLTLYQGKIQMVVNNIDDITYADGTPQKNGRMGERQRLCGI